MIKEIIANWKERNSKFQDFDELQNHQEKFFNRKLSHNERELIKLNEKERQKEIIHNLKMFKLKQAFEDKRDSRDLMKFNSGLFNEDVIFTQKNMFIEN